jgi:hypothetical protein
VLAAAVVYWVFQVVWFWRYCGRNINADAISYIGIARHIRDGNFAASLHGYWSPLISWLLAAAMFPGDRTQLAHLLMLPLFVLCQILTYCLTQKLWGSRLLSSLAVLWFTAARGVAVFSICFVGADLLLTAATLAYFIVLLPCLKQPEKARRWLFLGLIHAVAFLAKSIAMPLFALATILAVLSFRGRVKTQGLLYWLLLAAVFPALTWLGWSAALHHKYGMFTGGYQLRWNLLDPEAIRAANRSSSERAGLLQLTDTRQIYDSYMISDSMPPNSVLWQAQIRKQALVRQMVGKEIQNLHEAAKQLFVLLTPGGILALILSVIQITRSRRRYALHFHWMTCVLCTATALLLAYCMLVFDARYVLPIIPLLIALSVRFVVPARASATSAEIAPGIVSVGSRWQTLACVLLLVGLIFVQLYWASPFRTIHQDFQLSVYNAAGTLKQSGAESAVTIGQGPYPEHGVGWEAGLYAAYFSGSHLIGTLFDLPQESEQESVIRDVGKLSPDAIMVWGSPGEAKYASLVSKLQAAYPDRSAQLISDPGKGIVGAILIASKLHRG